MHPGLIRAGITALGLLLALPGCGLVTTDLEGHVRVEFEVDDDDAGYGSVTAAPGTCAEFRPCADGACVIPYGLRLQESGPFWIATTRAGGRATVSLCAARDAPPVRSQSLGLWSARSGLLARGHLLVTTAPTGQEVAVVATP